MSGGEAAVEVARAAMAAAGKETEEAGLAGEAAEKVTVAVARVW